VDRVARSEVWVVGPVQPRGTRVVITAAMCSFLPVVVFVVFVVVLVRQFFRPLLGSLARPAEHTTGV
jgi:hypothetical protein